MTENKPKTEFKAGLVKLAKWVEEKETKDGSKFDSVSYTFQRSYKDKDGNWKNTSNLQKSDLLKLARCLENAYDESIGLETKEV